MRSFEIFVEPRSSATAQREPIAAVASVPASGRRRKTNEVLDLFIHGANVTALVAERHASCVLRDLAWALAELCRAPRGKRIVRFYEDAWELCVERLGREATLSVYRGGADPSVLAYDRAVVFDEMCASVVDALGVLLASPEREDDAPAPAAELRLAHDALVTARHDAPPAPEDAPEAQAVVVETDRDAPIVFAAEFAMRPGPATGGAEASVERADLHALLVRARMRAEVRGRAIELGEVFPFLFAERMLDLVRRALDAWERGQGYYVRLEAGGVLVGLRVAPDRAHDDAKTDGASCAVTMRAGARAPVATFPELPLFDVVEAALAFGRALVRAVVRRDRTQSGNLRLAAYRRDLRAVGDALREVKKQDALVNPAPESYRAFAQQARGRAAARATPRGLRYAQRWRALVPGIDLRATFLCGDRIVIGAALETFCLDRTSGELVWRQRTPRAACVVTPAGLARIAPDGAIAVHDFATGEVALRAWVAPRLGASAAGAVVSSPGLPKLLVVTEGDRHLVAIDLTSGEARWRYACGRAGAVRLKRVGRLLYVACGDSALTAVDVQTGAVVWRVRDRLRFHAGPAADHDALFAVAGGAGSTASVHAIDPYSGRVTWTSRLPTSPCTTEGPPLLGATSVAVAVRDRRGLRIVGFDRETGAPLFHTDPVAPIGTSWLAVDDLLCGNTPTGELVGVDAARGAVRWRRELGRSLESDVPRRLEAVLRSGALFVPHVDVHVVRPSDGELLGMVGPCDAIPDLLRVDERCDVYVAEESGHMVAFGAGPRLSLVK
jgi:outer membrane protein assembly factor BamB